MSIIWKGVFPAVTTKFTDTDELDFDAFDKNIEAQIEAGVKGIVIGGSLGEASVLTDTEKTELLKHTVKVVNKRAYVILNIAEQTTRAALACAALVVCSAIFRITYALLFTTFTVCFNNSVFAVPVNTLASPS